MMQTDLIISSDELMNLRSAIKVFNCSSPIPVEVLKESRVNDHIMNINIKHFNSTDLYRLGKFAERMKL